MSFSFVTAAIVSSMLGAAQHSPALSTAQVQPAATDSLSLALVKQMSITRTKIDSLRTAKAPGTDSLGVDITRADAAQALAKQFTAVPVLVEAIKASGLSPEAYAQLCVRLNRASFVATLAQQMPAQFHGSVKAQGLENVPPQDVAFVSAHMTELEPLHFAKAPPIDSAAISAKIAAAMAAATNGQLSPALDSLKTTPMPLKFTALDGRTVDLAAKRGKLTIVDFSGYTWCEACRILEPQVVEAYKRYHDHGLDVVGFALEDSAAKAGVEKYVKDHSIPWPLFFDGLGMGENAYTKRYGITSVPFLVLLDENGLLIGHASGSNAMDTLEPIIKERLGLQIK